MSNFSTTIPVPVDAVISKLPRGAFHRSIKIGDDKKSLVLEWEHDDWKTPYTGNVEISPEQLAGEKPMPECVRGCPKVSNSEVTETKPDKVKGKK